MRLETGVNFLLSRVAGLNRWFAILVLFGGLVVSAPFSYYIPQLRLLCLGILGLLLASELVIRIVRKNDPISLIQLGLVVITLFYFFLNLFREYPSDPIVFIIILVATFFSKDQKGMIFLVKAVVLINIAIMVLELLNGQYLLQLRAESEYEIGRMQGLFSYSKETSFFLICAFLLVRHHGSSNFFNIVFLISSFLSGSRTSLLLVALVLAFDFILKQTRQKNLAALARNLFYVLIFLGILVLLFSLWVSESNLFVLTRIMSSFDIESSSHQQRLYFWTQFWDYISSFSLDELLFGKGTFIENQLKNGAENTYLMLLSQFGFFGLFIFMSPLLLVALLTFKNLAKFYPFILLLGFMFVGRLAVGWADGILLWILIIGILNEHYTISSNDLVHRAGIKLNIGHK